MNSVCIVLPAYNEAEVIGEVVRSARTIFRANGMNVEFIVVNDNSKDDTSKEARKAGAVVIDHILNSGVGAATATGLSYAARAGFDVAATMDADGQHSPEDVLRGINIILNSDTDLLIGSRLIDSRGMSRTKVFGNRMLSLITGLLFRVRVTDSQSGLRVLNRRALEELRWTTSGYEFCSEMLWRASQLSLCINEYPIKAIYTDYSIGKGQSNWNVINIIKSLLKRRLAEIFE